MQVFPTRINTVYLLNTKWEPRTGDHIMFLRWICSARPTRIAYPERRAISILF